MDTPLWKRPIAIAPVLMSLAALGLVTGYLALYGRQRQADEGTAAHLFQLLMVAQLPLIGAFAVRWLPRAPRQALGVLLVQGIAIASALATVFVLER